MPQPANKQEQLDREVKAWEWRCKGWTEQRIATELGLTQPGVHKILKRVAGRRYKELAASVEEQKALQTEQLDHIQGEALDAWERSKEDAEKTRTKALGARGGKPGEEGQVERGEDGRDHVAPEEVPGMYLDSEGEEVDDDTRARMLAAAGMKPDGTPLTVVERVEEVKGQVGDPRFLAEAQRALAAKRQIWGLDAPQRAEVSGPGGGPVKITEVVVELVPTGGGGEGGT